MTPRPPVSDAQARSRLTVLLSLRAAGVVLMLAGLGIWLGGWTTRPGVGTLLFVLGAGCSFLLPSFLAHRWRSPRS